MLTKIIEKNIKFSKTRKNDVRRKTKITKSIFLINKMTYFLKILQKLFFQCIL